MKVRKTVADYFLETLKDLYLFKDGQSNLFAKLEFEDHHEVYRVDSEEVKYFLIEKYMHEFENTIPSDATLRKVRRVLEVKAARSENKHQVYTRVANLNEAIYIDLCNDKWEV